MASPLQIPCSPPSPEKPSLQSHPAPCAISLPCPPLVPLSSCLRSAPVPTQACLHRAPRQLAGHSSQLHSHHAHPACCCSLLSSNTTKGHGPKALPFFGY